jgi:hypothetical protein
MPVVPYIVLVERPVNSVPVKELTVTVQGRLSSFDPIYLRENLQFIKAKNDENKGYFSDASVADWQHY